MWSSSQAIRLVSSSRISHASGSGWPIKNRRRITLLYGIINQMLQDGQTSPGSLCSSAAGRHLLLWYRLHYGSEHTTLPDAPSASSIVASSWRWTLNHTTWLVKAFGDFVSIEHHTVPSNTYIAMGTRLNRYESITVVTTVYTNAVYPLIQKRSIVILTWEFDKRMEINYEQERRR